MDTQTPQPDDLSAYAADAELSPEQSTNILATITITVRELVTAQKKVKDVETLLKTYQEQVRNLTEFTLPQLMDEAMQKTLVTQDGTKIERKEVVRAGISEANLPAAVAWLNANGQGSIVKRELKLAFGRGEEQRAAEALDTLREHRFTPTDKMSVHPQTLAAMVRELLAEGRDLPTDLLGIYVQPIIKLTPA